MHRALHLHVVVAKIKNVKRPFLEFSRLYKVVTAKLSQFLFSLMKKNLIIFLFTEFKAKKQNSNDPHKKVKNKPEM